MNRSWAAAAIAALVVGFGGGFLAARGIDGGFAGHAGAQASAGVGAWSLFGKPRAANAPRRGLAKPDGFAVWKTRLDTAGAQPLACIELTRPLDTAKAYGDFVLVSPELDHAPAVTARGDELCLGGVGFTGRRITQLKGLPAKSGETLSQNADVDFTFGDKPPYVGFAGEGVILPREDSDGVGIETLNVTRLAVEVWRVADRNLVRKSIAAPAPTAEGQYADDYGDDSPDDEGRIVWKGLVSVTGPAGAKATTVFPLGAVLKDMQPGGYVIKARDASDGRALDDKGDDDAKPAQARRWVMFTDMALIAYSGSRSLDVVARSLKTAKTLGGLPVALLAKDGETLASTRTDASGRAAFAHALLGGEGANAARMVMAYGPRGDLAVLDLDRAPVDLSKQGTGGRDPAAAPDDLTAGRTTKSDIDAYLYGDRGIYRPGERAHLTALVRDRDSKAPGERKGFIVVKRPSGVEFARYVFANTGGGAVLADVDLPKSAPRGHWSAEVHIDGYDEAVGDASFAVEDFAPQRLAVTVGGRSEVPVGAGETRAVDVTARFLYGATGSGLKTQGEARVRLDPDPFPAWPDYRWGDEVRPFAEKFVELGSTVTDGAGRANLVFAAAQAGQSADPLIAAVTASVFEPGGRPVRQGLTLKVRTKPLYLGVKVDQGPASGDRAPAIGLDVIAVDAAGRRVAASGVTYALIGENWNYDWFQQDGRWQWRRTSRDTVVARGALDIAAGAPARLTRRLGWGDYRLELDGAGGVRTVRRFSAGWGGTGGDAEAPDFVRVSAGAKVHAQGDTVEIAIKGPYAGEAQVAVATDRLIDFKTLTVSANGAVVRLKTTAAWGGGAYVLVSLIQPRDPVATPLPRRALGLVYVPLDPGSRRLTVDIGTPAKIDSRAPVSVPLTVRGLGLGQGAYVTVAAVDEGILALTRFESPDPVAWYFGKRALTVDYRDDYGRLMDANLGAPANVDFGGDEVGGQGLTVTPIKSVALWSGVVRTGPGGRVTVTLPPGDFNGELRIMAVAWTDTAVGSAAKPLTVREPVVADLNLPRFLAPGDRPMATLEIHNVEGRAGDYLALTFASGDIVASFRQVFRLLVGQRIAEHIPFLAPNRTGVGQVGFVVSGPAFSTTKTYPIQTRLGWGPVTRAVSELQRPGEAFTPAPALLAGLAAGDVELQVSYSPFKGFDPAAVALGLSRYPYGCTEQLVSTAYPLLYAAEVSSDPRLGRGLGEAVGKLLDRQSLDGAFGLWRVGDGEADPWLGAYVTDFLVDAKARGAPIPAAALDRALGAMRQVSRPDGFAPVAYRMTYPDAWGGRDGAKARTAAIRSRASAYALYVLAKAGRGDLPRLRWWHDVQMKSEASPLAKAQIGAGLAVMGDHARARSALRAAVASLGYKDTEDWYQSPLRDLAGTIALAYEAGESGIARGLQARLEGTVAEPDHLNTQEAAALLRAAHFMLAAAGTIRVEGTGATALAATAGAPRWAVGRLAAARFVNRGTGALWRTVSVRGTPLAAPGASASGLAVAKSYFTMSGAPANLAAVKQGERLVVRLSGRSLQGRTLALVVNDALPAGFEIETTLGPADAEDGTASGPFKFLGKLTEADVQESRDDRYVAALALPRNKPFAFAYVARAVTPGAFFLPGVQAVDMYRPSLSARSAGGRLTVAPAG
ncbi:MAG: alpha-2-macroglobulin [Caulobacteraceae bacterium]